MERVGSAPPVMLTEAPGGDDDYTDDDEVIETFIEQPAMPGGWAGS
jgi:hypothetical protein